MIKSGWEKFAIPLVVPALISSGCTGPDNTLDLSKGEGVPIAPALRFSLLEPTALQEPADVDQLIVAKYAGQSFVFEAHLQIDAGRLDLVALDGFGRRLETIRLNGTALTSETSRAVPPVFSPEQILANMEIVFGPDAAVAKAIKGDGGSYSGSAASRHIGRNGADELIVVYEKGSGWNRIVHVRNIGFGYSLDITSVQSDR